MRICFIVDNLEESAGWGRLASNLIKNLKERGYEVGFVVNHEFFSREEEGIKLPLRNFSLKKFKELVKTIRVLRQYLSRYDLVVCFDANPYGIITALSLIGLQVKFVLYAIGTYSLLPKDIFKRLLVRLVYMKADQVLIVGNFVREQIEKSGQIITDYKILPVGVGDKFFVENSTSFNSISKPYVIGVGGIKHRKGFHVSIEAFAEVAQSFPNLTYLIVGNVVVDEYYQFLKSQIKEARMEKRIKFIHDASDSDLKAFYSSAEFFVLTPITTQDSFEGFGMVYLEAAACGLASIGTRNSGAVEAIVDGRTGVLVEQNSAEVSKAITNLMNDRDSRLEMANNAKIRAKAFSWGNVTDQLISYLQNVK